MNRCLLRVSTPLAFLACVLGVLGSSASRAQDEETERSRESTEDTVKSVYKESVVVERTTTTREKAVVARKPKEHYTCAIFVANRSDRVDDKKVLVMQDFLTGHATDLGFRIIAREDVINSVAKLAEAGPNKGDKSRPGEELDEMMSNNTSALRLAQNMNADYVLMVTITSFGTDKRRFTDANRGIDLVGVSSRLKATYRLLDATIGGSQTAGVATASVNDRVDPSRDAIVRENLVDDLLDAASEDLAKMMGKAARGGRIEEPSVAKGGNNTFEVHCGVADLMFPEIVKDEHGQYVVMAGRYRLESLAVTVELDGVVVGTTPGPFTAKPGLHKMRLRRENFKEWQGTVNITDGQILQVALQLTDKGLAEFAEMTRFFQQLKTDTVLKEAQAKMWEGYAKQLEQSGVRIQKNVNIDKSIKVDDKSRSDLRRQIVGDDDAPKAKPEGEPKPPEPKLPEPKPE